MSTIDRSSLVARWLVLTRETLPGMARERSWPVQLDHCFMRICLDAALGAPWTQAIAAPAIRNMSEAQLSAAIAVAERCVAVPDDLPRLNARSLAARRDARLGAAA